MMAIPEPTPPEEAQPHRRARTVPFLLLALVVFLADQTTKAAVVAFIPVGKSIPEEGLLRLTHVTNTGAAFGILQGQTVFLLLVSLIGVFGILFYHRQNGRHSMLLSVALGLVLGGALGNLTDRLLRGAVVDFIDVELWAGYRWYTFNVADSTLMVGLALLAFYVLRQRDSRPRVAPDPPGVEDEPSLSSTAARNSGDPSDA